MEAYVHTHTKKPVLECTWQTTANSPKLDLPQANGWTVYPHHGILLSNKKHCWFTLGLISRKLFSVKKMPIPKGYVVYDSIYIMYLKWQNYRKWSADEWILGVGWEVHWRGEEWGSSGYKKGRYQRSLRSWNCSVSGLWWWIYEPTQAIELLKLNTHTDEYKQNKGNSKMGHLYQQWYLGCDIVP